MQIEHDSRNSNYRYPFGARPAGACVHLRLRADRSVESAWVRAWFEGSEIRTPMRRAGDGFEAEITLPDRPGIYWYYFIAQDAAGQTLLYGNAPDGLGGPGAASAFEPQSFQITLYDPAYTTPEWMHGAPLYQIFPDRFASSGEKDPSVLAPGGHFHKDWSEQPELRLSGADNEASDFFGGDLKGITAKLDYLKGLGVRCLYLNPIFRACSNHKYDTSDYRTVDPSFGTQADLEELCAKAKEKGIRVLLDGVFSHTGSDSVYFDKNGRFGGNGAYCRKDSPYASWYTFRNWPDDYVCWWDFPTLPNVNENDPAYRDFIVSGRDSVAKHYLRAGTSGWRLDVADELPMEFLRAFREHCKKTDPDAGVIGEVWEDASRKIAYNELRNYCAGDTLDGCMNYPLRDVLIDFLLGKADGYWLERVLESQRENYAYPFLYACMNLLGSHDKPRAISVLSGRGDLEPDRAERRPMTLMDAEYARGCRRYLVALRFIAALPGMPSVYYGDEAGLTGMADPFCRGTYPWGREDTALRDGVRAILSDRPQLLRTGFSAVHALSGDHVVAVRWFGSGRDAFGREQRDTRIAVCALNRSEREQEDVLMPGDVDGLPLTRPLRIRTAAMSAQTRFVE